MRVSRLVRPRSLVLLLLLAILAMASFGFAATNTVPGSSAGDGSGTISGYAISNIDYTLDSSDAAMISAVDFDIVSVTGLNEPSTVKVQFTSGGDWQPCAVTGGTGPWSVTCTVTGVTAQAAVNLRVVAAQ
jgi:hypothetical protein